MKLKYKKILSSIIFLNTTGIISAESISMEPLQSLAEKSVPQKKIQLTRVSERYEVLENYFSTDYNNPDPTVFNHLLKWHDEDFKAIQSRIKSAKNIERLNSYESLLKETPLEGSLGFHKLAHAYYLYSLVLSNEIDSESELEDDEICDSLHFIKTGESNNKEDDMRGLRKLIEAGYKCLPFVNWSGHTNYRTLNKAFGMGIPLLGLPLKISSHDGNYNRLPHVFYTHDVNHLNFEDYRSEQLKIPYGTYEALNTIVSKIPHKNEQFLCDYFLYDTGHEGAFTQFIKEEDKDLYQSSDFISYWGMDKLFLTKNTFLTFLNRWARNGSSPSGLDKIENFIADTGLSRDKPLTKEMVINAVKSQDNPDYTKKKYGNIVYNSEEIPYHYFLTYNELLELKNYTKDYGYEIEIWDGDKLNFDSLKRFHEQVVEAVMKHIYPNL